MDNLIKKISEIEAAAASVMDNLSERKAAFAAEIQEKTAAFDQELEQDTAFKLNQLRSHLKKEMQKKLKLEEVKEKETLNRLDNVYETNHSVLAAKLFEQITKE